MAFKTLGYKVLGLSVTLSLMASEASAFGPAVTTASAPEIDGPAGIAAIALLVSAGIVAYNRFKK